MIINRRQRKIKIKLVLKKKLNQRYIWTTTYMYIDWRSKQTWLLCSWSSRCGYGEKLTMDMVKNFWLIGIKNCNCPSLSVIILMVRQIGLPLCGWLMLWNQLINMWLQTKYYWTPLGPLTIINTTDGHCLSRHIMTYISDFYSFSVRMLYEYK